MKVTRVIHPIGQGGFYTETLREGEKEINVVYDCGGFDKYGEKKMQKYLKCYLSKSQQKKKIEAIFISHFHADHINGLQHLLENAEVKYLFLPQLTEEVMMEAIVYNYYAAKQSNSVNNFLMKLYLGEAQFGPEERPTRIIQVDYSNDSRVPEEFNGDIFSENGLELRAWNWSQRATIDLSTIETLPANTMLHCSKWLYIPYNSKVIQKKKDDLKKELGDLLGANITVENLPSLVENRTVKSCKAIYDKVFGPQQNHTSMTLFSGTSEHIRLSPCKKIHEYYAMHLLCDDFFWYLYCNPNILYTGDFEPADNMNDISSFYSRFWKEIGTIQVPHHGSILNYKDELYEHPIRGIVSAGNENQYHHPDMETLVKIQEKGCHPVIVTEDKSSMKIYHYEIE